MLCTVLLVFISLSQAYYYSHITLYYYYQKPPSLLQYAKISLPLHVQWVQIWYAVLHIYLVSK